MPRIFVSYRRDETEYVATALHEKLTARFGGSSVFVDVDAIPAGRNFRQHLERAVGECDVVLAVIGKHWLDVCDEAGRRRLDLPTDWVRIELESALARHIPVIPLLVAGAAIPPEDALPEPLRELVYRQALPLRSGRDFQRDVDVLRSEIERTCAQGEGGKLPKPWWRRPAPAVAAVVLLALAGGAGLALRANRVSTTHADSPTVPATAPAPVATLPVPEPAPAPRAAKAAEPAPAAMVSVPAGPFFMGCNEAVDTECEADEKPGRPIDVAAFHIDRTEVTVAQYAACVKAGACSTDGVSMPFWSGKKRPEWASFCNWGKAEGKAGREEHPINCLTWAQARAYCTWTGKRLATEAEWEKAARGTDKRKYPWGNTGYGKATPPVANIADEAARKEFPDWTVAAGYYDDGWVGTAPVGSYPAGVSPYGAADMVGNVWEWVQDEREAGRVVRGGSWHNEPGRARASTRTQYAPGSRNEDVGVRCAQ
jgi:formylglycine-generating enzyme required for sulfatase activity